MGNSRKVLVWSLIIIGSLVSAAAIVGFCYASSKYNGKYQQCLNESGGRASYSSVQYACNKAATGNQNGCSLWIGSAGSHGINTIYAEKLTGTVRVAFWGMCTDRPDLTKSISVSAGQNQRVNNVGIVADGNLNRGIWPNPTAVGGTLDVATFIAGATRSQPNECEIRYTRKVWVGRYHSDGGSYDEMEETVTVVIPTNKKDCIDDKNLCKKWTPAHYAATATYGRSDIIVKGKNTNERFHGAGSGMWSDDRDGTSPIYAMPKDEIAYHSCYYPGVQATAFTMVSDINGNCTAGCTGDAGYPYREVSDQVCGDNPSVGYTKLVDGYKAQGGIWDNRYWLNKADLGANPGKRDIDIGRYTGPDLEEGSPPNKVIGTSPDSDVGKLLEEKGHFGDPLWASITDETPPPKDVMKCPCCEGQDPKTCVETNDCYCCTNAYRNQALHAEVHPNGDTTKDWIHVIVPYNFINDTSVTIDNRNIYSGEGGNGGPLVRKVSVKIGKKYNGLTMADYATVVKNVRVKLFMYITDEEHKDDGGMAGDEHGCDLIYQKQCLEVEKERSLGTLNDGEPAAWNPDGVDDYAWINDEKYNAFDASAGDYLCFMSAMWPYTSGADDNTDPAGDNLWKYSEPKCYVVNKKPTFQVWGDSMYAKLNTENGLKAFVGAKRNIYNAYIGDNSKDRTELKNSKGKFKKTGGGETYFGSWVEESLILKDGLTDTVASGAATGLNSGNYAGAGSSSNFCDRSPLTFANDCKKVKIKKSVDYFVDAKGNSGIDSGVTNREELIDYWVKKNDNTSIQLSSCNGLLASGGTCDKLESATGENIFYIHNDSSNANIIASGNVPKSTTYLIKSKGTVTIENNIVYDDGKNESYKLLGQVPKVIIYAEKGINIRCDVTEVDAILITGNNTNDARGEGALNTCYNGGGVGDPNRQHQLRIFGTAMMNSIDLGRTFGAAANQTGGKTDDYGMPSDGAAAEIFDYDSTILMWSEYMSGSAESDTLDTVYQHELAPRY